MRTLRLILVIMLVGVAVTTAISQNYSGVQTCQTCHSNAMIGGTQYTQWITTRHAVAYDSVAIIQNNRDCLICHTTGWDTLNANHGFDDYYLAQPPDQTGMNRTKNVQCESCHGPVSMSSNHGQPSTINVTAERCGSCHEGEHHPYYSEWATALHAVSDTNANSFLANMFRTDPNCAGCHTYQGFMQFVGDSALEPNVTPPGTASEPLVCAACHDPHSATNAGQLRLPPAELCQKCHNPEYNPDSPTPTGEDIHHSTAYMFEGKGGYHFAGYTYESSFHKDVIPDKCVTCHVVMIPWSVGAPASTGHTFEPKGIKCFECHSDFDTLALSFNYRNVQHITDSLLSVLANNLASASSADSTTFEFKAAKFNYDFVNSEGSHGIHNTKYAWGLVESAILNFTPTGVKLDDETVPAGFALSQNYPNPFNPTTKISVQIPVRSTVRMNVYAVTGELVTTLMSGTYDAGTYQVTWNGHDDAGLLVANGVYLYRLETETFSQTRKMVFMK